MGLLFYEKESNVPSPTLAGPWKGVSWANNRTCPSHWVCGPRPATLGLLMNLLPGEGVTHLKPLPWACAPLDESTTIELPNIPRG